MPNNWRRPVVHLNMIPIHECCILCLTEGPASKQNQEANHYERKKSLYESVEQKIKQGVVLPGERSIYADVVIHG